MKSKSLLLCLALISGIILFSYCKKEPAEVTQSTGTCSDGLKNQNETDVDCGGVCSKCVTCSDGIKNQGETGIDCGGPCNPCPIVYPATDVYGKNLLGKRGQDTVGHGYYSLSAKLPIGTKIKIAMSNRNGGSLNYGYVSANTNFQVVNEQGVSKRQFFIAEGPMSAYAELVIGEGSMFPDQGDLRIDVYENEDTTATWTKFVHW